MSALTRRTVAIAVALAASGRRPADGAEGDRERSGSAIVTAINQQDSC